jgi:hypothetical protein
MSEYAVHFTKGDGTTSAYWVMMNILATGRLEASGPFGAARSLDALANTQMAVCFSEIPLDRLDRLVERRSNYGIAFKQDFLVTKGGARVWYVDNEGQVARTLRGMVSSRAAPGMDLADEFWKLTPFVDYPSNAYDYRFEWEREWRVPGGLSFDPDDVAFLFIPDELHAAARSFFQYAIDENTGPGYPCPYLDPQWSDEQLQAVFNQAEL